MTLSPKEIGRAAGRIFEAGLPHNWACRSQEDQEDYGVDGEIEIINENEKASGFIFKVQIKGQEHVEFIENGQFVSFSIAVDRLNYYMNNLEIAIVLVVVDITTRDIYWKCLQDDTVLKAQLITSVNKGNKTITVHLPTKNILSNGYQHVITSVTETMDWLKLTAIERIQKPISDMVKKSSSELIEDLIRRNKELNFHLYNEQYERLLEIGDHETLYKLALVNIKSLSELVETRFNSGIYLEKVIIESEGDDETKSEHLYNLYCSLIQTVRAGKGNSQLRMYSLFLLRSFLTKKIIEIDYHAQLTKMQTAGDPLTSWLVRDANSSVVIRTASHVQKIIMCINRLILKGKHNVFTNAIVRSCLMLSIYSHRLYLDDKKEKSDSLYDWLGFCLDIAIGISKKDNDQKLFANLIILTGQYRINEEKFEIFTEKARNLASEIIDTELRAEVLEIIEKKLKEKTQIEKVSDPESELRFFTERAINMGFKIDDPNDEIGKLIRQGLDDYNPQRVIKHCDGLLMYPSSFRGIPAQMLGLYSVGMKYLVCIKKKHIMGGWRLDDIYINEVSGFKNEFCKSCADCVPRADEWYWTMAWQEKEFQENKSFLEKIK